MLKGFVSGEEKGIKRIPMKGKNLYNIDGKDVNNGYVNDAQLSQDGTTATWGSAEISEYIPISGDTTYTFNGIGSYNAPCYGLYDENKQLIGAYRYNGASIIHFTSPNNARYFRFTHIKSYLLAMVVEGSYTSSTMPDYEPYGYQEGWEVRDNQDRLIWGREDELQTATGTLPFKGYGLPVKVKSLLGNAVQNGTPAPSPVNPNLVDPSATVPGYQESNGNIHTPSSGNERTTDWIPFTTSALYAIVSGSSGGNINWVLYDSSKQPLYFQGPTFNPNTVITISRGSYSTAAFIRISWTNAANQPICVTTEQRSEYIAFDPNPPGPVIPEMCGVRTRNLFDGTYANAIVQNDTFRYIDTPNAKSAVIPVEPNTTYTLNKIDASNRYNIAESATYPQNGDYLNVIQQGSALNPITFTTTSDTRYLTVYVSTSSESAEPRMMLNLGSTALPYEPYGWKVPFENRGENLCYLYKTGYRLDGTGNEVEAANFNIYAASASANTAYTINLNYGSAGATTLRIIAYNNGSFSYKIAEVNLNSVPYTFTTPSACDEVKFSVSNQSTGVMLNPGSTPKPYSTYLNATIPVYLGEVPTVRRVKKLVLDGTETFVATTASTHYRCRTTLVPKATTQSTISVLSTHYYASAGARDGTITLTSDGGSVYFTDDTNAVTAETFKAYLASEYAAGHPVTIWYALETLETTISNEPLCKISTYADELTTIQVHGLSAPLYGIGDYKDTLNFSTGVVTRKVKKLVFDGTEDWALVGSEEIHGLYVSQPPIGNYEAQISSHFIHANSWSEVQSTNESFGISYLNRIVIHYSSFRTSAAFKAYLAAQYAAGTPVAIWYVLSTPTTETVTVPTGMTGEIEGYLTQVSTPTPTNRSVPKWNGVEETGGTYAVTVYAPPEIPTTTGQNTLTVETEKIHGLTNPLCGIGDYKDVLNLSTGVITRKIKKLVLTGEESGWSFPSGSSVSRARIALPSAGIPTSSTSVLPISTHYVGKFSDNSGYLRVMTSGNEINIADATNAVDETTWKSFLAAQYQNGTPVTIWYVLETPETETITVPYGLECSVEGYLTQSTTPTPSSPIDPTSNGILESGGTYAVEVSLVPSNMTVKGHIKELT